MQYPYHQMQLDFEGKLYYAPMLGWSNWFLRRFLIEQLTNQIFEQKILIELCNTHDFCLALSKTLQDEYSEAAEN